MNKTQQGHDKDKKGITRKKGTMTIKYQYVYDVNFLPLPDNHYHQIRFKYNVDWRMS